MHRRQLHSRSVSENKNGVDSHMKDNSTIDRNPRPPLRDQSRERRGSSQEVFDDGTKTFFW